MKFSFTSNLWTWIRACRQRPGRVLCWLGLLVLASVGAYKGGLYLWAWNHYRAGQQALQRRDFAQAQLHLATCLKVWPDSATTHFLAARAARQAGAVGEAEEHLFACQRLGDATDDTLLEWALLQAQRGRLPEVEEYLRRRLADGHPDSLLILETLTKELMWANRYADARQLLDVWLGMQPEDGIAWVRRGWVAEHLFDYPAAVRDYEKALAFDPQNQSVRLHLAELLVEQNRHKEALDHLHVLQQQKLDNPAVIVALARCLRQLGQVKEAVPLLEDLLAEHPQEAQALSERGMLELETGQAAKAEVWLRAAVTQDPYNQQVNYHLCQCLQRLGKNGEAQKYLARLKQIDDDLKRMRQVIAEVMKRPHDPALRHEAGLIFLRNGRAEDGLHWLATALVEDPQHRPTHEALAEYYERTGDRDRAARHRQFLQDRVQEIARPSGRSVLP